MVVIGFDPGSISFGVGLLNVDKGKIDYLHSEEIKLKEPDFRLKMERLWKRLGEIYKKFSIDEAAIEEGFLGKNPKSMNIVAQVRGVVLGSLIHSDISMGIYSPREVKKAITGNGNAAKAQVARMIQILLNIKQKDLGNDESDALAVAYCHALSMNHKQTRHDISN
jgi:crossover junction endodeoxyribonuclease RuvC